MYERQAKFKARKKANLLLNIELKKQGITSGDLSRLRKNTSRIQRIRILLEKTRA